jgi:hypothetical protein
MKRSPSKIQYGAVVKFKAMMGYCPLRKAAITVSQIFSTLLASATIGICNSRVRPFTDQISAALALPQAYCASFSLDTTSCPSRSNQPT